MPILPVTRAALKRLCGIGAGDTSSDADLDALILDCQAALEYGLDPSVLAASGGDAGLSAILTLGAAESLAGEWLRRAARAPGASDDFHVGPLSVSASRTDGPAQAGERLAAQGARRLEPFARAARLAARDALGADGGDGSGRTPLLLASPGPLHSDRTGEGGGDGCFED